MRVAIIGCGYVGLVSGACMADFGHVVTCVDKDAAKIAALQRGEMPIFEPGLGDLVAKNVRERRLLFTPDLVEPAKTADVIFIAVGTPSRPADGLADLTYVYQAAREIADAMVGYKVIVNKSTVPVGTGDEITRIICEARPGAAFAVVSNPEFLREGAAIADFMQPDRIVIGTSDERARRIMSELYRPLVAANAPILFTERRGAELIKYAANAFLATKITFINEIADLCEKAGANVQEVARGIGLDDRIGPKFLNAGPGYGGSCFPKDLQALMRTGLDFGAPIRSIETIIAINDQRKRAMARKIIAACGGNVRGSTLAILGLTFKPNTDDMREAPSVPIITALQDGGANIRAYDPEGMKHAQAVLQGVEYADDPYACIKGADALVIMTEWDVFRKLDLVRAKSLLRQPIAIDLRNIYQPDEMQRLGFTYVSVGRSPVAQPALAAAK
ncbi:MAG: UDP-glucose/GDP-mannose dehydrogenase family protein [Hyphomicrobiaceae bacterium]|nr:MAG: UDP-glucose/GDP-mannose dehydrogenase family protein [Hyphomicrobiaceae bacterium]